MLDEQAVLQKLNISDFRHLTKNNVIDLATELHNVDPEVAKKILDQFPDFTKLLGETLTDFRGQLDAILESENKSEQDFVDTSVREIDILEAQLSGDLSFDEKLEILDRIDRVREGIKEHQSEKRHFLTTLATIGAGVIVFGVCGALSVLGINIHKQIGSQ